MPKRVLLAAAIAVVCGVVAAFLLRPPRGAPDDAPSQDQMADAIGSDVMRLLHRGQVPNRSGDVMLVPRPHNFIYRTDLTTLQTPDAPLGSSHPNPWDYLVRVPIIFWGPGYIDAGVKSDARVDIAGFAPTYARLLGMDPGAVDGRPFQEIVGRAQPAARKRPPKVIFNVVIDGGGWNVLQEHPRAWPAIARLGREGTTYTRATIGSAPSITGALHATFGTGDYPLHHGLPGNQMRDPDDDGEDGDPTVDTWREEADPRYLESPAQAELWDEHNGNRALVATVAYEGWHLGMIGHGAERVSGDRDIAVLWDKANFEWWINEDYFTLPSYLQTTDIATLERYERGLDERDGFADDLWFDSDVPTIQEENMRPGSPAFARFTGDAVVDVLRNEPWGRDGITDIFWVEMKMPDYAGHIWNMISAQEEDVIAEVDAQIARFKRELDRKVGRGNYIFAVSADHGQQPVPEVTGGWRISQAELERDVEERFGPIVAKVTPVDLYFDLDLVAEEGIELRDVARFLGTYTVADNIAPEQPGAERVPEAKLDEKIFAGAFSADFLASLSTQTIQSFGASDYPEGALYKPRL